ncbi:MAG: hypothetical protein ACPGXK_01690 [Phycisphaerae bacterium]
MRNNPHRFDSAKHRGSDGTGNDRVPSWGCWFPLLLVLMIFGSDRDCRRCFGQSDVGNRDAAYIAQVTPTGEGANGAVTDGRAISDAGQSPSRRVIYDFDFAEADEGNIESVPKFWEAVRLPGFPNYTDGKFDMEVGHAAPPSFALHCSGRNVAYAYSGPDTRVRRNTDYGVEAFIRTRDLRGSRACLSAHFLDRRGLPIPGTVVRSRFIGDEETRGEWVRIQFFLPSAPVHARTIGLMAWVFQEPVWDNSAKPKRHITLADVHGKAWFDDITVYAMPRVELATTDPGNILADDRDPTLRIVVADFEDTSLSAKLSIFAADGGLAGLQTIKPSIGLDMQPNFISVQPLHPGLYTAVLRVFSHDREVVRRTLTFARVAAGGNWNSGFGRSFGVVLTPGRRPDHDAEFALLSGLGIGSAKIPVWNGLPESAPDRQERRATDQFLQALIQNGFSLAGVFAGSPGPVVQQDGPYPRPLLELLSGPLSAWQDHMAAVVVPYAGVFDWWQIGPDNEQEMPEMVQLRAAIGQLREAMRQFVTVPRLGLATQAWHGNYDAIRSVDYHTVAIGDETSVDAFPTLLREARSMGHEQVSLFLEDPPDAAYARVPFLSIWSQRVVQAYYAGAATVYVEQPWRVRDRHGGRTAEPNENYLALRTLTRALGGKKPGQSLFIADGVTCLAFHEGDLSTLVLWDENAPLEGHYRPIQLGQADEYTDMWGRSRSIPKLNDGRHVLKLSPMPLIVEGVERWLVDLRDSFRLEPEFVMTGTELEQFDLMVRYQGEQQLSGIIALDGPEDWEFNRQEQPIQMTPQRVERKEFEVQFPHNAIAQRATFRARLKLTRPQYYFDLPLRVSLGLADVAVAASSFYEGDDVILSHTVTNRSDEVLDLRSTAIVPGKERKYRPFTNLRPGETQTVEYRFRADSLRTGQRVRLAIRELNDGPRTHNIEVTVP